MKRCFTTPFNKTKLYVRKLGEFQGVRRIIVRRITPYVDAIFIDYKLFSHLKIMFTLKRLGRRIHYWTRDEKRKY